MDRRFTRRTLATAAAAAAATTAASILALPVAVTRAQETTWAWSMPIGYPEDIPGDGFFMRHGFATENTWYNPGWYHAAEDYYVLDGNAAGANVYAVADGEVVFAGSEYPGLVVIVRHEEDLYSMYGHLAHDWVVESGPVTRGQVIGTVYDRTDGRAPSHLHFEIRTFLMQPEINGSTPRYDAGCTLECPPGPGYWPIDDPQHPSAMGWRNPLHVIASRSFSGGAPPEDAEVVVARGAGSSTQLWSLPAGEEGAEVIAELTLIPGTRYRVVDIAAGPEDTRKTSAEGYRVWYRIEVPGEADAPWVQVAIPSTHDTGSDGRASSVRIDFLPLVQADE